MRSLKWFNCNSLVVREGGNAWTASENDFGQQLIIDLGSVMNITRIATQGRPHSAEYVREFGVSYGYNGLDYADYKEPGGDTKVTWPQGWWLYLTSAGFGLAETEFGPNLTFEWIWPYCFNIFPQLILIFNNYARWRMFYLLLENNKLHNYWTMYNSSWLKHYY